VRGSNRKPRKMGSQAINIFGKESFHGVRSTFDFLKESI
jgi:hypothetical protein